MRRIFIPMMLLLAIASLFAHPPVKIEAEFDLESHVLSVTYQHKVSSAEKHYIDEVSVKLNGEEILMQKLTIQADNTGGTLAYIIPDAKPGDTITVSAGCNKGGTKTATIEVKAD